LRFPLVFNGFFFGVFAYLFLGLGLGYGRLGSLLVGGLAGLGFGLVSGVVSGLVSRDTPLAPWLGRILVTLIGMIAGGGLAWLVMLFPPPQATWILPSPPEPVVHLRPEARLGYYGGEFTFQSVSGKIYGYACLDWLVCHWREVPETSVEPGGYQPGDCPENADLPEVRATNGGTVSFTFCRGMERLDYLVTLSANGEISITRYLTPAFSPAALVMGFVFVGGFFGWAGISLVYRSLTSA
jgi:hypothetical protein